MKMYPLFFLFMIFSFAINDLYAFFREDGKCRKDITAFLNLAVSKKELHKDLGHNIFFELYGTNDINFKREHELRRDLSVGQYKSVFYDLPKALASFISSTRKANIDKMKIKNIYMFFVKILIEKRLELQSTLSLADVDLVFMLAELLIYLKSNDYPFDSHDMIDAKECFLDLQAIFSDQAKYADTFIKKFASNKWKKIIFAIEEFDQV